VEDPEKGAAYDAADLKAADGVQDRLALTRENVEHVADQDAGLGTHGGAPEAEQRAVACDEQSWDHDGEDQDRNGGMDDKGAARQGWQGWSLASALLNLVIDQDAGVIEEGEGQGPQREAIGPVARVGTRVMEEIGVPARDGGGEQ